MIKRNLKFFVIVISLLLVSALVLTGCMYAIAADNGEMKPYDLNGQKYNSDGAGGNIFELEDAPLAQTELQKKFNRHLHRDGNTVTVFSEEQYAELKSEREEGIRNPLTYDEILFLINDSVNMYFTYNEIKLTNAVVDGISHHPELSSIAEIIYPYHGDYSEFEKYDEALDQYNKMLEDIYSVIYYRIYVHDAGFNRIKEAGRADGETIVFAEGSELEKVSSIVPRYSMQLLSLNESKVSGKENRDHLVKEWEKMVELRKQFSSDSADGNYALETLDAPLLTVYHDADAGTSLLYQIFITDPKDLQTTKIYPTNELSDMCPQNESLYFSGDVSAENRGPAFALDKASGRFSMSLSSYQSFALMTGKYLEDDGVLKMYPENVGMEGYYSYVFHFEDGAWVYTRENSVPPEGAFDIKDGLKFRFVKDSPYTPGF